MVRAENIKASLEGWFGVCSQAQPGGDETTSPLMWWSARTKGRDGPSSKLEPAKVHAILPSHLVAKNTASTVSQVFSP